MLETVKEPRTLIITPEMRSTLLRIFSKRPANKPLKLRIMVPIRYQWRDRGQRFYDR
jgi:hypothetical protein